MYFYIALNVLKFWVKKTKQPEGCFVFK